jgi:hypothetical protein
VTSSVLTGLAGIARLATDVPAHLPAAVDSPETLFGGAHIQAMLATPQLVRRMGVFREFELVGDPAGYTAAFVGHQRATGASVAYRGIQHMRGPLRDTCMDLAGERWPAVHVVAFDSPAGVRACKLHFDPYAVLVVQSRLDEGSPSSKAWTIYRPGFPRTGEGAGSAAVRDGVLTPAEEAYYRAQEPFMRLTLNPGDALLVPAGWPHAAIGEGTPSLHFTVCLMEPEVYAAYGNADHGFDLI